MKQSEEFLRALLDIGIHMDNIHLGECKISQSHFGDDYNVAVTREFKIHLRFNMKFINIVIDIINSNGYSVELECIYKHSDENKIRSELLTEALADSKHKAEIIAQTMGKKIIGIDNLNHNNFNYNPDYSSDFSYEEPEGLYLAESHQKLSDEIKAPISTEREEVEVVWIME